MLGEPKQPHSGESASLWHLLDRCCTLGGRRVVAKCNCGHVDGVLLILVDIFPLAIRVAIEWV